MRRSRCTFISREFCVVLAVCHTHTRTHTLPLSACCLPCTLARPPALAAGTLHSNRVILMPPRPPSPPADAPTTRAANISGQILCTGANQGQVAWAYTWRATMGELTPPRPYLPHLSTHAHTHTYISSVGVPVVPVVCLACSDVRWSAECSPLCC
jgi:hypothetical protein